MDPVSQSHWMSDDQEWSSVCFGKSNLTHCFGLTNVVYFLAPSVLMKRDLVVPRASCRKALVTQSHSAGGA